MTRLLFTSWNFTMEIVVVSVVAVVTVVALLVLYAIESDARKQNEQLVEYIRTLRVQTEDAYAMYKTAMSQNKAEEVCDVLYRNWTAAAKRLQEHLHVARQNGIAI
jgi:type II secretory pathway pseudopilin PulG